MLLNKLCSLIQPGLKKITHVKLPGVASGLTRKNTSSSVSSMISSLNSSLPISPVGKNGNHSYYGFVVQISLEVAKYVLDCGFG